MTGYDMTDNGVRSYINIVILEKIVMKCNSYM